MTKTVYLLRHAKAAPGDAAMQDIDRPLNAQGHAACIVMGEWLASRKAAPQQVLCSPSRRTRETYEGIFATQSKKPSADYPDALYLAATGDIVAQLQKLPDALSCVMVIGHNPGMHECAARLCASGKPASVEKLISKFPTAACAVITLNVPGWKAVKEGTGFLEDFVFPKELPEDE